MHILLAPEAFKGKKKYTGIECWLKWPIKLFVTSNKHVISHQFTLFEICSLTSKRNSLFASSFSSAFWLLSVSCFSWWCNIRNMRYRDYKKSDQLRFRQSFISKIWTGFLNINQKRSTPRTPELKWNMQPVNTFRVSNQVSWVVSCVFYSMLMPSVKETHPELCPP